RAPDRNRRCRAARHDALDRQEQAGRPIEELIARHAGPLRALPPRASDKPPGRPPWRLFTGSSRISGEGSLDLEEEVIGVTVAIGHALDDLDAVVDALELAGMHRPAHPRDDAAPVAVQAAGEVL